MPNPPPIPHHAAAPAAWNLDAAAAAWLLPGLGHVLLGERARGLTIGIAIGLLWVAGLLIGGVGVIDARDNRIAFAGQMIVAPSIAVQLIKGYTLTPTTAEGLEPATKTGIEPPYVMSFNRVYEHGSLYTALAGMLNLLAIIDVLYRDPARDRRKMHEENDVTSTPTPVTPATSATPATSNPTP